MIEVYSLVKTYPNFVLSIDKLRIKSELAVLLGPNGSGKSTLMRILAGVLKPDGGEVKVLGGNPIEDASVRGKIAYVPGEPSLYDHLTAEEHLYLAEDLRGVKMYDKAMEIANLLGFDPNARHKLANELSSGLRRILSIAIAFGHPFEVAIVDEVTAFLDPPAIASFIEVLKEYKRREKTLLVSTHILPIVELLEPDRVLVISRGQIVAEGKLEELTKDKNLLDVFMELTGEEVPIDQIRRIIGGEV